MSVFTNVYQLFGLGLQEPVLRKILENYPIPLWVSESFLLIKETWPLVYERKIPIIFTHTFSKNEIDVVFQWYPTPKVWNIIIAYKKELLTLSNVKTRIHLSFTNAFTGEKSEFISVEKAKTIMLNLIIKGEFSFYCPVR